MADLLVFGYGSLMWRPDFPHVERHAAVLIGAHRSLCVWSWVHRGTRARPGLVLGLDRGGACRGVAFRVAPAEWESVVANLRAREQVTGVYLERSRPIRLEDGRAAAALTYIVDRRHPQYAGRLDLEHQLAIVAGAHGGTGANDAYVVNTARHLEELGIRDSQLEWLARRLAERTGLSGEPGQISSEAARDSWLAGRRRHTVARRPP